MFVRLEILALIMLDLANEFQTPNFKTYLDFLIMMFLICAEKLFWYEVSKIGAFYN